jgi:hypothetical protein
MKYSLIIMAIFIILQILDIITTIRALKVSGVSEGKKITGWLMDKVGVLPALLILFVVNTVLWGGLLYVVHLYGTYEYIMQGFVIIVCLFRVYSVYVNIRNMKV